MFNAIPRSMDRMTQLGMYDDEGFFVGFAREHSEKVRGEILGVEDDLFFMEVEERIIKCGFQMEHCKFDPPVGKFVTLKIIYTEEIGGYYAFDSYAHVAEPWRSFL